MLTEATWISPRGCGAYDSPGIFTDEQQEAG
jgi:hypothetical protein